MAVDTWEMVVVHRPFRREFRNAAGLVRGVPAGDRERAAIVAEHLSDMTAGLHHHHSAEDELLWPVLLERVSMHADLIHRMEDQHRRLAGHLATIDELLPRWRADADPETGEQLAGAFQQASGVLDEHLAEEEKEILPLVSEHVTPAEWKALGDKGQEFLPKNSKAFVFLGLILQDASPQERRRFIGLLPPPVRLAWPLVGKRIYRRAMDRLYGH